MVHRHFDEQLQELLQRVVLMGETATSMIQTAVAVLSSGDESSCNDVLAKEREVNALQVEIDDRAVKLIAMQQPVARDARFLFMAAKVNSNLERIADQAVNICQNAHYVLESPPTITPLADIPIMAEVALKMVRDSLAAMVQRDVAMANSVLEHDNRVDDFRDVIFRKLLTDMANHPAMIQRAISLILIARNLERVGDHATNIAEEVIYWIQGRDVRHGKGVTPQK